ncbi:peptidoglycan-binding protein [Baaleninema simplex]|uniref:peptidoglycan-binding protein n=1 Tax=Baaleninema simplex TaxID=2862350 RepID=UPI001181AFB8|nr:peptidoglycan-binding protein [Baaleninema simplex]
MRSFSMASVPDSLSSAITRRFRRTRSVVLFVTCTTCWTLCSVPAIAERVWASPRAIVAQAEDSPSEPSETPDPSELPRLSLGDEGEAVATLQQWLKDLGYYKGEVTGIYDLATDIMVADFQEKQGLPVDGVVGTTTWERLAALRENAPASEDASASENASSDPAASPEPNAEETSEESDGGGLSWLIWGAGFLAVLVVGGLLFFTILKLFREDVEYEEGLEEEDPDTAPEPLPESPVESSKDEPDAKLDDVPDSLPPPSKSERQTEPDASASNSWEPANVEPTPSETAAITPPPPSPSRDKVDTVTRLPRMSIVEALVRDLQHPDPQRRRQAIWELGQRGDSRAIQPLVALLTDSDSQQRSLILSVLAEIGTRTMQPMKQALMLSLQDDSPEVRKNAIRDLTRIYDSIVQMSQLLQLSTTDADAEVRETAKWAMSQLQRLRTAFPSEERSDDR